MFGCGCGGVARSIFLPLFVECWYNCRCRRDDGASRRGDHNIVLFTVLKPLYPITVVSHHFYPFSLRIQFNVIGAQYCEVFSLSSLFVLFWPLLCALHNIIWSLFVSNWFRNISIWIGNVSISIGKNVNEIKMFQKKTIKGFLIIGNGFLEIGNRFLKIGNGFLKIVNEFWKIGNGFQKKKIGFKK